MKMTNQPNTKRAARPVPIGRFDTFEQAQQFKPSQGFERVGVKEIFLRGGRTVFAALIINKE